MAPTPFGLVALTVSVLALGEGAVGQGSSDRHARGPGATAALGSGAALSEGQRENTAALMREWTEDVVYAYLDAWSSDNGTALSGVDELYAAKVLFFGRRIDRAALREDKRRFARRWPVRHYDHRPGTMAIACDVDIKLCRVRSILDYRAESPARGARSEGSAEFELGISFAGARPEIVTESGRVLRSGPASN
jgi:hypothetical protein